MSNTLKNQLKGNYFTYMLTNVITTNIQNEINVIDNEINVIDNEIVVIDEINTLIGDFKWSARTSDFYGWLLCDGRLFDKTQYATLYSIIGDAFTHVGDVSNNFRIPDCRSRVPGAVGHGSGLTNRIIGTLIGEETHQLTVGEIPAHNHTINDPGHTHSQTTVNDDFNNSGGGDPIPSFSRDSAGSVTWHNINSSTTGITINNTGGNGAHNIMQPTIFIGNVFLFSGVLN